MTTTIRAATSGDVPWLLVQLREFDTFFDAARSLFVDTDATRATLELLITEQLFLVAEDATRPVGFIVGTLGPHLFNPAITVLSELFWWVTPDARGSSAGALLFAAFMAHGRAHADWIVMTLESESPVHGSTLLRRGFRAKETSYLLEVEVA